MQSVKRKPYTTSLSPSSSVSSVLTRRGKLEQREDDMKVDRHVKTKAETQVMLP